MWNGGLQPHGVSGEAEMMETFKEFTFEAARSLPPHSALQGQQFKICLHLRGDPDPVYGWAANLKEVDQHVHPLLQQLDRRHLNEIEGLSLPSLENIACWIWDRLRGPLPALARIAISRGPEGQVEGCVYSGRT
jgi:6-pyruvoyltetrahydropterin/6-carboxytetrahydropterin synthase